LQNETLSERGYTTAKRDKIPEKKPEICQCIHIAELSTVVVKVDIKVINASVTQNQCLQCVTSALTRVEIPRSTARRH